MKVQLQMRIAVNRRVHERMISKSGSIAKLGCLLVLLFCMSCMGDSDSSTVSSSVATHTAADMTDVVMLTVDMYDNYYGDSDSNLTNPPIWAAPTGADVVVTLNNYGRRNHNWAIVKPGVQIPVPYEEGQGGDILLHGIGMVYGNSQTTVTFTAPEPGEYMVICTVSGHYPAMQGRLQITTSTAMDSP
ncbi:MAG: sulfocyanin-like copper-binding protein [Caldilineaceae bacterium]